MTDSASPATPPHSAARAPESPDPIGPPSDSLSPLTLVAFLVAALVLAYVGLKLFLGGEPHGASHPAVGTPLPAFQISPLGRPGPTKKLDDLKGFVSVVNFWGPWCGYCKVEMPHLLKLEEKLRENAKFQLLLVSCSGRPNESEADLADETNEYLASIDSEVLAWSDAELVSRRAVVQAAQLDGFGYPTTILVDPHGAIRGVWIGYEVGDEVALEQAVTALLAE